MQQNNKIQELAAKFSGAAKSILALRKEYDTATIESILTPATPLAEDAYATCVFNKEVVQAMFPKAVVLGVVGTPTASAPVTVMNRHGNAGWSLNMVKGYIQMTFMPGEAADVTAVNYDPIKGIPMPFDPETGAVVAYPKTLVNLKVFSNMFDDHEQGALTDLLRAIGSLQTGRTALSKYSNKPRPIYRGTDLTVMFQGEQQRRQADGTIEIVVRCIAILDTKPKTAVQLSGWGTAPSENATKHVFVNKFNRPQEEETAGIPSIIDAATDHDALRVLVGDNNVEVSF